MASERLWGRRPGSEYGVRIRALRWAAGSRGPSLMIPRRTDLRTGPSAMAVHSANERPMPAINYLFDRIRVHVNKGWHFETGWLFQRPPVVARRKVRVLSSLPGCGYVTFKVWTDPWPGRPRSRGSPSLTTTVCSLINRKKCRLHRGPDWSPCPARFDAGVLVAVPFCLRSGPRTRG